MNYGSFNGKFQLPRIGMNGQFTIYTKADGGKPVSAWKNTNAQNSMWTMNQSKELIK